MSKNPNKQPVGAPIGSQNGLSHGVVAFKNQIKRRAKRGRSLIDRRTSAGQNAMAVRDEILRDLGGAEGLAATKLVLFELTARDVYFCDEIDRRIFRAIYKLSAKEKALESLGKIKNPKMIATLYGYRVTAANNLARNLLALGLEKAPPKQKTLEEILDEDDQLEQP
jgi:hypothetical protein